jgi:hypothetical protein
MNEKNIRKALDHFRTVRPDLVDMSFYRREPGFSRILRSLETDTPCGTVGCFVGHSVDVIDELEFTSGFILTTDEVGRRITGSSAVMRIFDLGQDASSLIFYNYYTGDPEEIKQEVIRRVEVLLEKGEAGFLEWARTTLDPIGGTGDEREFVLF